MKCICTECKSEDDYNFALDIGLCNPCIGKRFDLLQAQLVKAKLLNVFYVEGLNKSVEELDASQNREKALKEKNRWIPVGEGLPEEDVKVLVVEGKFVQMGVYQRNSSTLRMQWIVNGCVSKRVARWRALPSQ